MTDIIIGMVDTSEQQHGEMYQRQHCNKQMTFAGGLHFIS